jgi:hypothetical protein
MKRIIVGLCSVISSYAFAGGTTLKLEFESTVTHVTQSDTVVLKGQDVQYPAQCSVGTDGKISLSYKTQPKQAVRLDITKSGDDFVVKGWYGTTKHLAYSVEGCKVEAPKHHIEPFEIVLTNNNRSFVYQDLRLSLF